jgi:hypothetical protein
MAMIGTGPNPGPGSGGTGHDTSRFDDWLRRRLAAKGYQELATPQVSPVRLVFRWPPSSAFYVPRVIGVVHTAAMSNSIAQTCKQLEPWFEATVAHHQGGDGLLLFLAYDPSAASVDEIKAAGFYAGNAAIVVGAYDLAHGKHWVSRSNPCEADIFGS